MEAQPPNDDAGAGPPSGEPRPSLFRRLFSWMLGGQNKTPSPRDAVFIELGAGPKLPPGTVLGPSRSERPASPLANAYAQAARAAAAPPPIPAETVAAASWRVLEPPESTDPTLHQVWKLSRRHEAWTLVGASVRGRLHAHNALWRDDAFTWNGVDAWTCIAVADGAGSAPLSRVGAATACTEGVRALSTGLAGWQPAVENGGLPSQDALRQLRTNLVDAGRQALAGIRAQAAQRGRSLRDFHTTYLLVAHTPLGDADLIGALQVGDGAIAMYTDSGECRILGDADHGAYSSETRFLTTPGIEEEFEGRTAFALPRGLRAVALMTDGVADDFFPEAQRLIDLFEGDPIADLKTPGDAPAGPGVRGLCRGLLAAPGDGRALADWLQYEKRGSSDDRTLVLLYRQGAGPDISNPGKGS